MSSRRRLVVLAFGLTGLALSVSSSWVHYRLLTDPTYVSPCDINQRFNCTQVYLSRYGSVRGVPVALGGVVWFTLVSLVAGSSRTRLAAGVSAGAGKLRHPTGPADSTTSYVFALATIGLGVIIYLAYVSLFELRTFCILCMGTYACVLGIFVTSALTTSTGLASLPRHLLSDLRRMAARPVMMAVALLYVAGAASAVAFFPKEAKRTAAPAPPVSQSEEMRFADAWSKQPRVDVGVSAGGARVVIVKFNDWMCPSCKVWQQMYQPVLDKYAQDGSDAVQYVVKDWPWNSGCNSFVAQTLVGHEAACDAAAAVRMARDHGKAEEMGAWLFENQERLSEIGRTSAAASREIKAKVKAIADSDFDAGYPIHLQGIRRDASDGRALDVHCTPTFFVNGVRTTTNDAKCTNLPAEYLDMAIRLELSKPNTAGIK